MSSEVRNSSQSPRRRWSYRLAAMLLGLSLFALAEAVLAVLDVGRVDERDDPFVGFDEINRLFVPDESGAQLHIPRSRQRFFAPESFPIAKGDKTFRIFCLGGSTVQGRPYSKETSFTTWLQLSLAAARPQRDWEVVNCGGISYASYRLAPILEECLAYDPDLFVVCTGHNEFLEERTYGHIRHAPPALKVAQRYACRLRTYALLRGAYRSLTADKVSPTDKPRLSADARALLDFQHGIEAYRRDAKLRAGVIAHYDHNVRRMIALSRQAGVPLILVRPPSNLRDCPPFKSQHRSGLSQADLSRWHDLVAQAKTHYRDDLSRTMSFYRQAIAIDPEYAATHYELGRCYQLTGDPERARESLLRAREFDVCPLRMIAPLEEALSAAAADTSTPLIDAFALLAAESRESLLGDDQLVDHVHPKFRGHQQIANALADLMVERGWVHPQPDWTARREESYQRHFDSLESIYFSRGLRELQALREWAAGRADAPPPESASIAPILPPGEGQLQRRSL